MSDNAMWLMIGISFLLVASGIVAGIVTGSATWMLLGLVASIAVLFIGKFMDRQ